MLCEFYHQPKNAQPMASRHTEMWNTSGNIWTQGSGLGQTKGGAALGGRRADPNTASECAGPVSSLFLLCQGRVGPDLVISPFGKARAFLTS